MRPEFAAWRYGGQLRKRLVRNGALIVGVGTAAVGLHAAAVLATVVGVGGVAALSAWEALRLIRGQNYVARVPTGKESILRSVEVRRKHLDKAYFFKRGKDDLFLELPSDQGVVTLPGERAIRALQYVLPAVNVLGGGRRQVSEAVQAIERAGDPHHFMRFASRRERFREAEPITEMDSMYRLALEIAVNEEMERETLQREVAQLALAWKEAEEIAAIADNMFLPESVDQFIRTHRSQCR
jgi:hypothetical protein